MTITTGNLIQAVANLNEMTRKRMIVWHVCEPPRLPMTNALRAILLQGFSYCAPYQGKILRITEYRPNFAAAQEDKRMPDVEMSQQNYTLDIADDKGGVLYQFPIVQGIADLFQTVRIQMADVDEVINSLLDINLG